MDYEIADHEFYESATVGGEPARSGRLIAERLVDLSAHDSDFDKITTVFGRGDEIFGVALQIN